MSIVPTSCIQPFYPCLDPPFFDLRVVPLAVDSLGPSKNFIVFLVHNLTINTGRQNSPPYHLQYILGGSICQRLFFFYHIPITYCIKRLTTVIPIQQQPPSKIGFPPDLISLIMLLSEYNTEREPEGRERKMRGSGGASNSERVKPPEGGGADRQTCQRQGCKALYAPPLKILEISIGSSGSEDFD